MGEVTYSSKFGGMWIDRSDWREELRRRKLGWRQSQLLTKFRSDGYVVLKGAASANAIDVFRNRVDRAFKESNAALLYQTHGDHVTKHMTEPVDGRTSRMVDCYAALPEAIDLFSSPQLIEFLQIIFGEDPLLFQSLSFAQGSQQRLHQDTAYVVVNRPMELAACWIALEDIQEGSGELMYLPGSHHYPDWNFSAGRKHWDGSIDGLDCHEQWIGYLRTLADKSVRGVERFFARKGDILVWHADLAHGGSPVTDPNLSRHSLVGHFCPQSARPNYFDIGPMRTVVKKHGSLACSSGHYDLATFEPLPRESSTQPGPL